MNIDVHCTDQSTVVLTVGRGMSASEVCMKVVILKNFIDSPLWVLVECIPDLGLGKASCYYTIALSGLSIQEYARGKVNN